MVQTGENCGVSAVAVHQVVDISFVVLRPIPMVFATMQIPQLQFLNEVIHVPGVQVVQVLPSRLPVVCNDRCPPQLQFINKVVHTPVEVPRLSHGPDCLSDQRDPQLLDTVVDARVLKVV